MPNQALLRKIYPLALPNFRRARRYEQLYMKIPSVIGDCKLMEFSSINPKNGTTSQTTIEVAGALCGPAQYLAICGDEDSDGFYLFFCNDKWNAWNDMWFEKIEDAKNYAESEYPNSRGSWRFNS